MKIHLDQLSTNLKKLVPVYLISGNEPLLMSETLDQIRSVCKKQNIEDGEKFVVTAQFNWAEFIQQTANFSLFGDRKLIEITFAQKVNALAAEHLIQYLEKQTDQDNILVVMTDKLDATQQKSAWFNLINKMGVFIPIFSLSAQEFPRWMNARLKQAGLLADQDTIALLCERTNGNLLAAKQEIEKLLLTFGQGAISFQDLSEQSTEQGQYDVFALVDACLNRSPIKANKILIHLEQTGIEAPIILWGLTRELRQLIAIRENMQFHGMPFNHACQKVGVWSSRQALLQNYLKSCKLDALYGFLQQAAYIDRLIKGVETGDIWQALLTLCVELSGTELLHEA